jgi:capsular exopolysaccharide synthesis family protein
MLRALQRRWLLVVGVGGVLGAIAAAAAWFLLTPKFTVFAQVYVASNVPYMVFPNPESRNDFMTYLRTQAMRIKSRFVLHAALKRDEVRKLDLDSREPDPVLWLEDELKVDFKEGSEIVTLSMKGHNPDELKTLVNAVVQSYLQEIANVESKRRSERVRELDGRYIAAREKLRKSRVDLDRLANRLGTSDSKVISQQQLLTLTTFNRLKDQYSQVRYDLMRAQGRLAACKSRPKASDDTAVPEQLVSQAVQNDVEAKYHMTRIAALKQVVADYDRNAVRKQEVSAIRVRQELDSAKTALEDRRKEIRKEVTEQYRQHLREQTTGDLSQVEAEVAPLVEQEKWLREEVDRVGKEAAKIGTTSGELDMLRDEIKRDEQLVEQIGTQLDKAQIELSSANRVSLDQEAALQRQDRKRQLMAVILAPLAALLGVAFCVSWWENRSRRIQTVHEVVSGLGLRVMGAVPVLPNGCARRLVLAPDKPEAYGPNFLESIDAVRTLLLRDAKMDGTKIVMVTSAVEGEGKTTLASHLGSSLARAGRKTLLIDSDLRRPVLQTLFDVPLQPGLSEALLGKADIHEAVHATSRINGLYVLPAGQWDHALLQVLAKEGPQSLFDKLRPEFDFIIVDSHPVLAATDALLIGQHVDAVILSLLRNRSQAHVAYAAWQRLWSLGIRVLGAVFNGIQRNEMYDAGYQLVSHPTRR